VWGGALGWVLTASAAEPPVVQAGTAVVEPGARYELGWLGRFVLGSQWRDLWTTPIEVPVLDLGSFDGGLTPDREGGGLETSNLHFKSGNGRHWAFRSVDKDLTRVLPPEARHSLIGALAQDFTSTENPAGAVITAALQEAAGVLHSTPTYYVMPDDTRLDEFRSKYRGMLGLMELRDEKHLPNVEKVLTTYELFERLEKRSDEQVDPRDYLRVRLMDIFVADWDRHVEQYRWVRLKTEEGAQIWRTVPRDRDAAFSTFDGIFPTMTKYYTKQVEGFGDNYSSIEKLSFAGQYTDRWFLVPLEKQDWDQVTADLQAKLSDSVIDDAVHRIPKEMYAKDGAKIIKTLRSRRDKLPRASETLYRLLAKDVDIRGTKGADDVEVSRNTDGSVEVWLYRRDEQTGDRLGPASFHRTLKPDETNEIRLYLLGGKDRVRVTGPGEKSMLVRIITGGDSAEISDQSHCGGCTDVRQGSNPPKKPVAESTPEELKARYQPTRDWGWDLLFFPLLAFDSSRGLVIGAKGTLTTYGFELAPFANQTSVDAAYSTGTNQPRFDLATEFKTRSPLSVLGYITYSGMDQANFFGFGNETVRDPALVDSNFYQVRLKTFTVRPLLDIAVGGPVHARIGGLFKHASGVENAPIAGGMSGSSSTSLMAAEVGLEIDTTSPTFVERRGLRLSLLGRYYPKALSLDSDFAKVRGSVAYFLNFHVLTDCLFSVHLAGEKNWGGYPWFEAAFLGGVPTLVGFDPSTQDGNLLRGYDLNRFAGDASSVANVDLRIAISTWNSVLPIAYGVMGLTDVGRVFYDSESSSKWHWAAGGGIWLRTVILAPGYHLVGTFNGVVVASAERTAFLLYSGFGF